MGASPPKFQDLEALNNQFSGLDITAIVQLQGSPIGDPFNIVTVTDGRYKVESDVEQVAAGDLAYAGNRVGIVTAVLNDGEGSPANNRIEVTYPSAIMPETGVDPVNEVVTYHVIANDEVTTGDQETQNKNSLLSLGVVILKEV